MIGFVGSLKPWHGLELLLEAVHSLPGEEDVGLVFVGDGPMRESLEETCGAPASAYKAVFTGAIPYEQIPAVMKAVDVLVAPYPNMKGFYFSPVKVFEYMASGRPVVASRIGQIGEILEDEKNALLVPAGNSEALANALLRLKSDAPLRDRLGRAAQADVRSQHTWNMRVRTVEPIFESLRRRMDHDRSEAARAQAG